MVRIQEARQIATAWLSVAGFALSFPFRPTRNRARKLLVASSPTCTSLPLTTLDRLIGQVDDSLHVTIKAIETRQHNCSLIELCTLATIAAVRRPTRTLEIGTFDGRSAIAMAANLPEGSEVVTINLPPDFVEQNPQASIDALLSAKVESGYRWKSLPESARITQIFVDSRTLDVEALGTFQMIFVDGDHSEAGVTNDTKKAKSMIDHEDGIILFHDATRYGVRPALEKMARAGDKIALIADTSIAVIVYRNGEQQVTW